VVQSVIGSGDVLATSAVSVTTRTLGPSSSRLALFSSRVGDWVVERKDLPGDSVDYDDDILRVDDALGNPPVSSGHEQQELSARLGEHAHARGEHGLQVAS